MKLKLRAWNKQEKEMIHWHDLKNHAGRLEWEDFISDYELMIWTGLKDKNGKCIFEGDIVKDLKKERLWEIVYDKNCACFSLKSGFEQTSIDSFCFGMFFSSKWELAGNIYQNPDLMLVIKNQSEEEFLDMDSEGEG